MRIWDAIIVGAGPAGCAAAYDLAAAGRAVLVLDRCDFPRPKACAGGLTMKTLRALRYSVEPVTREVIRRIALENGKDTTLVKSRNPVCVMTVRSELDDYCLKKTLEAGADFRKIDRLIAVERFGEGVVAATDNEVFRGRFLIGADGANSQIRRWLFPDSGSPTGFALEARVPFGRASFDLTFDFGAIRNGYGWIFPKGDHLNVGMGHYLSSDAEKLTRTRLLAYVKQKLSRDFDGHVCGQYLGIAEWNSSTLDGRVLLAGDAAGLTDPLTAEGIYSAIVSGQAAAEAIGSGLRNNTGAAEAYEHNLHNLREELRISTLAARAFYADPGRGVRAAGLPFMRAALVKTYAQGMSSVGSLMRVAKLAATCIQ